MSRTHTMFLAALLVMATIVMPGTAVAQQGDGDCYPPGSPECDEQEPEGEAAVTCEVDTAAREVDCTGEGFAAGSEAELELVADGDDGEVVGSGSATVGEDGTFTATAALACSHQGDEVTARTTGTSDQGQSVTFTERVDVSDAEPCDDTVLGDELTRGGPDGGSGSGGLAFTGTDWLLLAAVALALIAGGIYLVRRRHERA